MGRATLIALVLAVVVASATPAGAASSGAQPYNPSNSPTTYSTTSPSFGTATATIQETSGETTTGNWTFCGYHAMDGGSCAGASHLPAGTVSHWVTSGQTTMVTLPNGAGCYQHTDASGVTWCYAGEPVQDNVGTTGGPFGAAADTSVSSYPNQGEAWWGSGGGPNDPSSCEGMFGNAPSDQASLPSCENQFGTVTWDTGGSTIGSIGSVADEMAWRIGSWNGSATPGGVSCGSRTAIGGTAPDSQAPNGLWMQWASSPARGFWNCTAEDGGEAGAPQPAWNGTSWYARSASDWNGFGWYLVFYDYASFIETAGTATNGVATSINCGGFSSDTTVTGSIPSSVTVAIDESSGLATFTDQNGAVLSEVSCTNGPSPRPTDTTAPPAIDTTTTYVSNVPTKLYAAKYYLSVPVGESGSINVLSDDVYHGTPTISIVQNAPQPGTLDTDPSSINFGAFVWSPTSVDTETATYQLCDNTGCAQGTIGLSSFDQTTPTGCEYYCGTTTTTPPPSTTPPAPNVHLDEGPTPYPAADQLITLTGTATNPTEPAYDLSIRQIDGDTLLADCGQVLTCQTSLSYHTGAHRFIAILSYPDGAPSQLSNEIDVTWAVPGVVLTACPSTAACNATSANPAAGAAAYLTATAENVAPVDESDHIYWKLVIVDAAANAVVSDCPIGLNPCQTSVTQPGGTTKTYFAELTWQYQSQPAVLSNQVTVQWGTTSTTSTTNPPPPTTTTTQPPPPPPTTTTSPPPPTTGPPGTQGPTSPT